MGTFLSKIKEQFKEWNQVGMRIPVASDNGTPSITMLFTYVSFLAVLLSLIYLHVYPDKPVPTLISILAWSISLFIYRMRRIDKLKFDLDDKSFEVDAEDDNETKKETK